MFVSVSCYHDLFYIFITQVNRIYIIGNTSSIYKQNLVGKRFERVVPILELETFLIMEVYLIIDLI